MSYESFKSYMREHRQSYLTAGLCLAVFGVGYGTGVSWHAQNNKNNTPLSVKQNNYTTKSTSTQMLEGEAGENKQQTQEAITPKVQGDQVSAQVVKDNSKPVAKSTANSPVPAKDCPVKGNISKDSKIYHVSGGSFYNRVKPEQCFQTEAEAKAAGFRKSTR